MTPKRRGFPELPPNLPPLPALPVAVLVDPEIEALRQRNLRAVAAWNARHGARPTRSP